MEIQTKDIKDDYKITINHAYFIFERKQKTNEFFTTLNSIFITAFGFIKSTIEHDPTKLNFSLISLVIIGVISIMEWKKIIDEQSKTLQELNEVIEKYEDQLKISVFFPIKFKKKTEKKRLNFVFFIENNIPTTMLILYMFYIYLIVSGNRLF